MCESLKCKEETEDGITVLLLIGLKVTENFDNSCKEPSISVHGSMIVQNLLKFNKPIKVKSKSSCVLEVGFNLFLFTGCK